MNMRTNDVDGMIECRLCLYAAVVAILVFAVAAFVGIWLTL